MHPKCNLEQWGVVLIEHWQEAQESNKKLSQGDGMINCKKDL